MKVNQIQSLKMTKAFARAVREGLEKSETDAGGNDNSVININYQPISVVNFEEQGSFNLNETETLVWAILEKLPKPKLKHLSRLAVHTCFLRFKGIRGSKRITAEYLGLKRAAMQMYDHEFKKALSAK